MQNKALDKNKSITKNTFFNFLSQIITVVAPLLTGPYISRVLNADLIGKNSYIASIVSYFTLFIIFGTSTYGVVVISKVRNNVEQKSSCLYELMLIKSIMLGASLLVYLFFILFYQEYQTLLLIYVISLITNYIDITWFYQGNERFDVIALRTVLTKIIAIACIFIFVKKESDFYLYVIFSLLSALIPNLLILPSLRKNIVTVPFKSLNINRHWKELIPFFLTAALISIYTALDKTMIRVITGSDEEVGYYEQAYKIYSLCSTLVVVIGPVLNARISYVYSDKEKRDAIFDTGFRFVYLFSFPIMSGCLLLANMIIDVYCGEGYDPSKTILMVFSALPLITGMGMMSGHLYYTPTFKTKLSILACGVGSLVNFVLNIIFAKKWGAVGAAIATDISEGIITIIEMILFKDGNRKHLLLMSWHYILASGIMALLVWLMMTYWKIDNQIIALVAYVLIGAVSYFTVLFLLREPLCLSVSKKVVNKFRGKKEESNE